MHCVDSAALHYGCCCCIEELPMTIYKLPRYWICQMTWCEYASLLWQEYDEDLMPLKTWCFWRPNVDEDLTMKKTLLAKRECWVLGGFFLTVWLLESITCYLYLHAEDILIFTQKISLSSRRRYPYLHKEHVLEIFHTFHVSPFSYSHLSHPFTREDYYHSFLVIPHELEKLRC